MNEEKKVIWLTLKEVSEELDVSISTVYRYINVNDPNNKNPLPSYKVSRLKVLVSKEELDQWVKTNLKVNNNK